MLHILSIFPINPLQLFQLFNIIFQPIPIFPNLSFFFTWTKTTPHMKINCRGLVSLFATTILIGILFLSSLSLSHEQQILQRQIRLSRRLLFPATTSSMASFSTMPHKLFGTAGAAMKEPKKAVDPSLRKAPSSVPNPTQNK